MWNNYFFNIQKKYSMRVSNKEPLVIRFDGKDVTKNKNIDLMNKYNNSFIEAMEKAVEHFTRKYKCYAIFGSDEVSFIFPEPIILMADLDSDKTNHSNEIISLFSQYFFNYFNSFNKNKLIFWHAKCFSIPKEKIISYIKFRSRIIENVMVTYFLKRNNSNNGNVKLEEKIKKCKSMDNYSVLERCQKGTLYYNGDEIVLNEFLNGKVVLKEKEEAKEIEYLFSDLF